MATTCTSPPPRCTSSPVKPLERLKYGDVVAYVLQLELLNESRTAVVRPQKGRFVVSYALWEEKFSVTQLGSTPGIAPRTVEGLSATAAETWCFDNLTMSTLGLAPNLYYWLRLGAAHRHRARFCR